MDISLLEKDIFFLGVSYSVIDFSAQMYRLLSLAIVTIRWFWRSTLIECIYPSWASNFHFRYPSNPNLLISPLDVPIRNPLNTYAAALISYSPLHSTNTFLILPLWILIYLAYFLVMIHNVYSSFLKNWYIPYIYSYLFCPFFLITFTIALVS